MPQLKTILVVAFLTIVFFAGYYGFQSYKLSNDSNCVSVKYNSYRTLHFTAITMQKLSENPENAFKESDRFLVSLYDKLKSTKPEAETKNTTKGQDYRLAFKPCGMDGWAFFALNKVIFLNNTFYYMSANDVESIVNIMDKWDARQNKQGQPLFKKLIPSSYGS